MFLKIITSILLLNNNIIYSYYLKGEYNYLKPSLERNNKVNKGIWVRNPKEILTRDGRFMFRANSWDGDNFLQNNLDVFGDNDLQNTPDFYGYFERAKRAANYGKDILQANKECKENNKCLTKHVESNMNSKFISKLKPISVFNDYPYEVAIMLDDNKIDNSNKISNIDEDGVITVMSLNNTDEITDVDAKFVVKTDGVTNIDGSPLVNSYTTDSDSYNSTVSRLDTDSDKKLDISEDLGNVTAKFDRGVFDKHNGVWQQTVPDTIYKVKPKHPKNKMINERGLVKVLSMLTKTFKKVMKQYNDIKKMYIELQALNENVNQSKIDAAKKYEDIQEKYVRILSAYEKIKEFEANMNVREENIKAKDREMSNNFIEFENQQKKFLIQQRQFYNIQKVMLAQNEKINFKQNLIAKTQSEISHRQNNFARILKKAKQIYDDNHRNTNLVPTLTVTNNTDDNNNTAYTTTPQTNESVKINLFSIPLMNKLENQDLKILKDKDRHRVDELVYKYYFNNTFIDNVMKNKILSSFITTAQNTEIARNAKVEKRNDEATTILLPVNHLDKPEGRLQRERRWLRRIHQSKSKTKIPTKLELTTEKSNIAKPYTGVAFTKSPKKLFAKKDNPFVIMARNFCNEINRNKSEQMLNWCIEKSLRRLQSIDSKVPVSITPELKNHGKSNQTIKETSLFKNGDSILAASSTTVGEIETTTIPENTLSLATPRSLVGDSIQTNIIFFPDNDELESNLKEFDLKPDFEGNVYYDGSLHSSDIAGLIDAASASNGVSDIMPSLDSNSRIDTDPLTFDFRSRRLSDTRLLKRLFG